MKVIVKRIMPGIEIGETFDLNDTGVLFKIGFISFEYAGLKKLIEKGWFEEVKEESLNDKLKKADFLCANDRKEIVQIAKEHDLEVFDKAAKNMEHEGMPAYERVQKLRKAIEEA